MLTLVLLRNDLRLDDNPALRAACDRGPILCVYLDESSERSAPARRWWLSSALHSLNAELHTHNNTLWVLDPKGDNAVSELADRIGATRVVWNRGITPDQRASDAAIIRSLESNGIEHETFASNLLFEFGAADKDNGEPRKVFRAFYKACLKAAEPDDPVAAPKSIESAPINEEQLQSAGLLSVDDAMIAPDESSLSTPWTPKLSKRWDPSLRAGHDRAKLFFESLIERYKDDRNDLDPIGSSVLSPWIRSGQLSIRRLWSRASIPGKGAEHFRSELAWREFSAHMLVAFPHSIDQPVNERFARFAWEKDDSALEAWKRGMTGYPVVDAAMRELWETGWMPNRARMIVASFLTKHLLIPWQHGAEWFMHTLVDADEPNNTMGWQWTAGCGFDAAPYFRIFNPITQGQKFDPSGGYIRTWVPELAPRPDKAIHEPLTPIETLQYGYPGPFIEHPVARERALSAYEAIKSSTLD